MKCDRRMRWWVGLGLGLCLIPFLAAAKLPPAELDDVERIVVIGDVHGNHDGFMEVLKMADLVSGWGRWSGGRTHLVQLGDIPDRGAQTLEVSDFLQRFAKQARRRKGAVHVLIGNHDAMNVYGDLRFVDPGEYAEFRTNQSRELLNIVYRNDIDYIKANNPEEKWPEFNDEFRKQWYDARPLGYVEHRLSWQEGEMNQWVLSRNTVMKIGRTLFLHGGIGPEFVDWSIDELNQAVVEALGNPTQVEGTILRSQDGPLWYRGLARNNEAEEEAHLEALLEKHDVDRIVLGHTVTGGIIMPRFGGRVILTDVGISKAYGENLACLVIEGDRLIAVHAGGEVDIPTNGDRAELLGYVEQIALLEHDNPRIAARLRAMQSSDEESLEAVDTEIEDEEPVAP